MATTTNFGWDTPDDTDYVTDGAAAMRELGQDIDTTLVDLKGGTTGQMLTKASNTDMDFTWASPNPGDITAVTAGTGLTGGGTSGAVTLSLDTTAVQGPTFKAYRLTSAQSITPNVYTKVQFNGEAWDTANCFDSTTNYRFTPNKAGYYQLSTGLLFTGNNDTETNVSMRKNGTNEALLNLDNMGPQLYKSAGGSTILYFNGSTDYVEVFVYVGAGSPVIYAGLSESWFTGVWIRS